MKNIDRILTSEVLQIMNFFVDHNEEIRVVGGAVRDFMIFNDQISDIDFATTAKIDKIKTIFKKNKFTLILTGEKFGSIAVISKKTHIKYEITTLRSDVNHDGRWSDVIFDADFEIDSKRRDFTINALYLDKNGKITDYHNGMQDLANKVVRFIGNPEIRINEDYLRIMRFFRFSAKFGNNIETSGFEACKKLVHNIVKISKERFTAELIKIAQINAQMLLTMQNIGLFEAWFGKKIIINIKYDFQRLNKAQILAVLFEKNIDLQKLDLSKQEKKFIEFCWKNWFVVEAKNVTKQLELLALDYNLKDVLQINSYIKIFNVPPLPINGNDLENLSGKKIGEQLIKAKKIWVENNFNLTKNELLNLVKQPV